MYRIYQDMNHRTSNTMNNKIINWLFKIKKLKKN